MKIMMLSAVMACLGPTFGVADTRLNTHLQAQDLYPRHARILQSDRPGDFRVLVTPNLIPKPPALVTAVGAGRAHCARLGKRGLRLNNVDRHAVQDISAWAMDFTCR